MQIADRGYQISTLKKSDNIKLRLSLPRLLLAHNGLKKNLKQNSYFIPQQASPFEYRGLNELYLKEKYVFLLGLNLD